MTECHGHCGCERGSTWDTDFVVEILPCERRGLPRRSVKPSSVFMTPFTTSAGPPPQPSGCENTPGRPHLADFPRPLEGWAAHRAGPLSSSKASREGKTTEQVEETESRREE